MIRPTHSGRRLVFDRYKFRGLRGCQSFCKLTLIRLDDSRIVVISTELEDNPGTSITNAAELLTSQVASQLALDPRNVVWIEHYPPGRIHGKREDWDLVTFGIINHDGVNTVFDQPDWRPMRPKDWHSLGLSIPPCVL